MEKYSARSSRRLVLDTFVGYSGRLLISMLMRRKLNVELAVVLVGVRLGLPYLVKRRSCYFTRKPFANSIDRSIRSSTALNSTTNVYNSFKLGFFLYFSLSCCFFLVCCYVSTRLLLFSFFRAQSNRIALAIFNR